MRSPLFSLLLNNLFLVIGALGYTSYANDWVDPDYIVAGVFPNNTLAAQLTILRWAVYSAAKGPWSVTQKKVTPPSGDVHDYMSWSPYWWPDCSNVGNTTELTPQEIWKECNYVQRDGQFNPDARLLNDVGDFQMLSDAVFYNTLAFAITTTGTKGASSSYSINTVNFLKTWFIKAETKMNPNLQYAQMKRGPKGQTGSHIGILDLKCMTKIVNAIEILRKTGCSDWTSDLDDQMNSWTTEYMGWLQTANLSLAEKAAPNNHGTFWSNQVAALKILIGDKNGALDVINAYFSEQYMSQITADGEQPLEAARTRPYHYHAYNLAAMITNARLSAYLGDPSVWNKPTTQGSTIKTALDFAMTLNASTSNETNHITNLFPSIAAVGAVYGDPQGLYAGFMQKEVPHYGEEANFLWNQPMAGGEEDSARAAHTLTEIARMPQSTSGPTGRTNVKNSAVRLNGGINWIVGLALLGLLVLGTMGSSC